ATTYRPKTAYTFWVWELFHMLSHCGKITAYDFYTKKCSLVLRRCHTACARWRTRRTVGKLVQTFQNSQDYIARAPQRMTTNKELYGKKISDSDNVGQSF
ncbi:hypothetical protein F5880DRAFT_1494529, partial [Lentinula raphanica]